MNVSGTAALLSTVSGEFAAAGDQRVQKVRGEGANEKAPFISMGHPFHARLLFH